MVPFKEVNKRQSSLTRNCLLSSSPFALSWTVSEELLEVQAAVLSTCFIRFECEMCY